MIFRVELHRTIPLLIFLEHSFKCAETLIRERRNTCQDYEHQFHVQRTVQKRIQRIVCQLFVFFVLIITVNFSEILVDLLDH